MLLIADSGSTKTAWRLVTKEKKILQFNCSGIHPFFMDAQEISSLLKTELCSSIGFPGADEISALYFYGTGCGNPERALPVHKALREVFSNAEIAVESDLLGAARGGCGHQQGIAVILGTGSNSCYYDGIAIAQNRPSLGFILGDEGSGAWIGKNLMSSWFYGELPVHLADSLKNRMGVNREDVLQKVYRNDFPNRYLASFSKFVFQNIKDPAMVKLVKDGFHAFFDKHILHYENRHAAIHATGSVAYFFGNIFTETAQSHGYTIGSITDSPIAALTLYHLGEI